MTTTAERLVSRLKEAEQASMPPSIRVALRFEAAQDKSAPAQVDKYFKKVKKDNPSYDDSQAWATAWSIYCKHKNPGSKSCHQDEYLTGKHAGRKPKDTFERHQLKVLLDTLKMPSAMAGVMGGPDAEEAEEILRDKFQYTDAEIRRLKQGKTAAADDSDHPSNHLYVRNPRHSNACLRCGYSRGEHPTVATLKKERELSKNKTAASLSDLKDALYNTPVKLKGYNGAVTVTQAHGKDMAEVLIKLRPEMSRSQHAQLAHSFAALGQTLQADWERVLDEAAQETWGRPFRVTDYRVSGIGSNEFSNEFKEQLRPLAQGSSKAKAIAEAHSYAAKSRRLTAKEDEAPKDELKDDEEDWLPGQKRGEWNLILSKYSPSRWSYFLKNPVGGGSGSTSYPSIKAAFSAGTYRVAWGEPSVNPGKKKVWVIQQEWDFEAEEYKTKKSYWWDIPENLLAIKFKS
jgi:hypothetical protein